MWWIIPAIYFIVVIGFLIAIYREAPKQSAKVGPIHYAVALLWPFWTLWFLWVIFDDWRNERKK